MKRILSIILTAAMLFTLVGCGSAKNADDSRPSAKNKTLTSFVNALQKADKSKADKYGDYDAVAKQLDISGLKMNEEEQKELVKAAFNKLEISILTVEDKDENTKLVTANLKTKNLTSALDTAVRNMYSYASNHTTTDITSLQHKNYQMFLEAINDKKLDTVSDTVYFTIEKKDGKWKVKTDTGAVNSLYGGYVSNKSETINKAYEDFSQSQTNAIDQSNGQ